MFSNPIAFSTYDERRVTESTPWLESPWPAPPLGWPPQFSSFSKTGRQSKSHRSVQLTSDEAADPPAPAVRLATERRESDGRFARR
jgi:hypothetical protein